MVAQRCACLPQRPRRQATCGPLGARPADSHKLQQVCFCRFFGTFPPPPPGTVVRSDAGVKQLRRSVHVGHAAHINIGGHLNASAVRGADAYDVLRQAHWVARGDPLSPRQQQRLLRIALVLAAVGSISGSTWRGSRPSSVCCWRWCRPQRPQRVRHYRPPRHHAQQQHRQHTGSRHGGGSRA